MEICHPRCLEILAECLESIPERAAHRALDVAGGDGRLSESFLLKHYLKVDLFDGCPLAVSKAQEALASSPNFGYAEEAYMQSFRWRFYYSGIFMIWCVGYLDRPALVSFLKVAKSRLTLHPGRMNRRSVPDSFLIVFDNVLDEGAESKIMKRQRVRSKTELESIYSEAGLIVHRCSGRKEMPQTFSDVCAWALC